MSEDIQELIQKLNSLEEGFRQNRLMTATLAKTAKACLSKAKLTDRLTEARCDLDATIMEAIRAEAVALREARAEYSADLESLERTEYFLKSAGSRYDSLRDEIRELRSDIDEVKDLLGLRRVKQLSSERFLFFNSKDFKLVCFFFLFVVLCLFLLGKIDGFDKPEFSSSEYSEPKHPLPENMTTVPLPPVEDSSSMSEKSAAVSPEESVVPSVEAEPESLYPVMESTGSHDADDSVKLPVLEESPSQKTVY